MPEDVKISLAYNYLDINRYIILFTKLTTRTLLILFHVVLSSTEFRYQYFCVKKLTGHLPGLLLVFDILNQLK